MADRRLPQDTHRTWRLPPVPEPTGSDLEGAALLREITDERGEVLWLTLRSATLWARAPGTRAGLFTQSAAAAREQELNRVTDDELRRRLDVISVVLAAPETVDPEAVATGCEAVARWAASRGHSATQSEFLRAAALCTPADPKRAAEAGKVARDGGDYAAAEGWFHRAIALGRRQGDWDAYARAYLGLGKMWSRRGRHPTATKFLERAVRAASRRGIRQAEAGAVHELFNLALFARRFDDAMVLAGRAAQLYGPGHPDLPALTYDVAYQWMEQGRYAPALQVMLALRSQFRGRARMMAEGGVARAAGVLGDAAEYITAAEAVFAAPDDTPKKATVLIDVAWGAAALGDTAGVERALQCAFELSVRYKEAWVEFLADEVRASVRSRETQEQEGRSAPLLPESAADAELAQELVTLLGAG